MKKEYKEIVEKIGEIFRHSLLVVLLFILLGALIISIWFSFVF